MPIQRIPKKIVAREFVPPHTNPYRVTDGDSWVKVARRHDMEPWDLIYLNYETLDPREVNWYLANYVGCKEATRDRKNWIFSSSADPGVIHVPIRVIEMPPLVIIGKRPSPWRKVWAGIGKSHSGDFFVVGAHDLTAKIYNLGDDMPDVRNAWVNVNGYKFGPGLGASIDAVFVVAHGYEDASEMNGVDGGFDWDLALGGKLSSVLKSAKGIGKTIETLEEYKKLRYVTENVLKNIGATKPGVYALPIPAAGGGLHAWLGYKFGDVRVTSTGVGIP